VICYENDNCLGCGLWICYKIGFGLDLNFGYIMEFLAWI